MKHTSSDYEQMALDALAAAERAAAAAIDELSEPWIRDHQSRAAVYATLAQAAATLEAATPPLPLQVALNTENRRP